MRFSPIELLSARQRWDSNPRIPDLQSGPLNQLGYVAIRRVEDSNLHALADASLAGKGITNSTTLPDIHDRTQTDIIVLGGRRSILLNYADPMDKLGNTSLCKEKDEHLARPCLHILFAINLYYFADKFRSAAPADTIDVCCELSTG